MWIDATLEIPITAQYRSSHEIAFGDRIGYRLRERAAVSNARGTTIADDVEPELLKIVENAGLGQVIGDDSRARSKAGFDERFDLQPTRYGFFSQKSSSDHDRRIAGVGAGGNRSDDNRPVSDLARCLVIVNLGRCAKLVVGQPEASLGDRSRQTVMKGLFDVTQEDSILRTLRTSNCRFNP